MNTNPHTKEVPAVSKPLEITVTVDDVTVTIAVCPSCRRIYDGHVARLLAAECCDRRCGCGASITTLHPLCDACTRRLRAEREQQAFAAAEKITPEAYGDGMVYLDTQERRASDYFASVAEALEWCEADGRPRPAYVWACTTMAFSMDAESVIDAALDEHHEDARDHINDEKGLQALLDAWCATQHVISYFEDSTRAIVIPPADPVTAAPAASAAEDVRDVF